MSAQKQIGLSEAVLGEEEKRALCDVITSGWLSSGEKVIEFENNFAELHDMEESVAVSSCTAGLHLVLVTLGIGTGDEVLVPGLTFVATVNSVLYTGATPVPIDIESVHVPHMSLEDARRKLGPKTKAVIIMHYAGYLMNMPVWETFCRENKLLLIEDAAHAVGLPQTAKYSDAAIFSFFANKNMTCAEGGMIISRDRALLEETRLLRTHAMSAPTLTRARGHAFSYDVTALGFNYRLDDLRAAVGIEQLRKLERHNQRRRELVFEYRKVHERSDMSLIFPFTEDWASAFHLMPVVLPEGVEREKIMRQMAADGIQTSIHYPLYHKFTWHAALFSGLRLPVCEQFAMRELTLPLHPSLEGNDVVWILNSLMRALGGEAIETDEGCERLPTFSFTDMISRGWKTAATRDIKAARFLFKQVSAESMTPEAAVVALACLDAVENKNKKQAIDNLRELAARYPASCEAWLMLKEALSAFGYDNSGVKLAEQCAQALSSDKGEPSPGFTNFLLSAPFSSGNEESSTDCGRAQN